MKELIGAVGLAVFLTLACFGVWYFGYWPQYSTSPIDTYERVYSECKARETFSHEQCHDIALEEAYPDD